MFRLVFALCRINPSLVPRKSQIPNTILHGRHLSVSSARNGSAGEGLHRTSQLDKRILVWTKRFPTMADVPDEVTETKMKKAKDVFRIRVNIMMALATIGLCGVYIWSGKLAVKRGENIQQQNKDRHFGFQKKD